MIPSPNTSLVLNSSLGSHVSGHVVMMSTHLPKISSTTTTRTMVTILRSGSNSVKNAFESKVC